MVLILSRQGLAQDLRIHFLSGVHLFQPPGLLLQHLHPLHHRGIHAAVFGTLLIKIYKSWCHSCRVSGTTPAPACRIRLPSKYGISGFPCSVTFSSYYCMDAGHVWNICRESPICFMWKILLLNTTIFEGGLPIEMNVISRNRCKSGQHYYCNSI